MPFTLAHPAAILPITRGRLVPSALVMGSMAPDLTYYVSLPWVDPSHTLLTRTHHLSSLLWLNPLIALVLFAVFHLLLKRPLVALLPPAAAERAWPAAERFIARRPEAVGWTVLSVMVGSATHLAWDRFGELFGDSGSPKVDLAGTVVGLAAILAWTWRWWQETRPQPVPPEMMIPARLRNAALGLLVAVPLLVGTVGALHSVQQLRAENQENQGVLLPESVAPQTFAPQWTTTDMADLALRTLAQDAVMAAVAALGVYAIGWQLNRLTSGGRGSTLPARRSVR